MTSPRPWLVLFVVLVGVIAGMFWLTDDAALEGTLLSTFDALVSFVVGGGAGLASGTGLGVLARYRAVQNQPAPSDLTWPLVMALSVVLLAMLAMFAGTGDPSLREQIVGYAKAILPFVVGAGAGALGGRRAAAGLI